MKKEFKPGEEFIVKYPFFRKEVQIFDGEGPIEIMSWVPGTEYEMVSESHSMRMYDGVGEMIITVVGQFKPGSFPTRVFYTRFFKTPDGKFFGKAGLRITTLGTFRRLVGGFSYWNESERREPA
jgi:hypothetical protein